ncbi:hypothetical protein CTA1_8297 [Colletotrichum tanaceti]|uniref:Uncharacterized protein n=1 Tax=Colletotrichum tanaceti TaxID=1306861 RepID=A0A4U6X4T4_9PEZI|nr:hypothetical protein CTA1_8297 [Colletotrichum tanaceti]
MDFLPPNKHEACNELAFSSSPAAANQQSTQQEIVGSCIGRNGRAGSEETAQRSLWSCCCSSAVDLLHHPYG